MGQSMRVTIDAAMRARDISRIRTEDERPAPPPSPPDPPKARKGEKRRLAKRRGQRERSMQSGGAPLS